MNPAPLAASPARQPTRPVPPAAAPAAAFPATPPAPLSQPMITAASWQLQDFIELGALPGAVPCARLHARQILREWHQDSAADTAELVIAELVTNSVAAARSLPLVQPVRVWLLSDRRLILILVADASPDPPVPADPEQDAESGRGLLLVEAVSHSWGWYPWTRHGAAKVVWALMAPLPGETA